jgi:hypothetical protein
MFVKIAVRHHHPNGAKDHKELKRKLKLDFTGVVLNCFIRLCNACGLRWAKKNKKKGSNEDQ